MLLSSFFTCGIEKGALKKQSDVKAVIFAIWGMLSGLVQLAANKQEYILQEIHMTKKEFLEKGFMLLYDAIKQE